jgi:hypothetical protein
MSDLGLDKKKPNPPAKTTRFDFLFFNLFILNIKGRDALIKL